MNYPLISEYIEAIEAAEDNFNELTNLRPVQGDDGKPVMTSGNFAVVFKMRDEETGRFYALKCFTKEQEGRAEAYHQIAEELKDVDSPYLVSLRYLEKELFVDTKQTDETEFPVLLMDWVEGKTLDKYLRENLDDKYALEMLAYRFSQLAQWLIPQPFAHGDLKPDNILVREDGTLVLVDYDGMYVPAMKGQKARELGSPDFRHPLRTENDFDEHIDDFPIVSILLSLKVYSMNRVLLSQTLHNRLLFSDNDYRDIHGCKILKDIFPSRSTEINQLSVAFLHLIVNSTKARYPIQTLLNYGYSPNMTKFKDHYYSMGNKYVDEYGVEYTPDKKVLLKWHNGLKVNNHFPESYRIHEGTEVICDEAFMFCERLTSIHLPKSIRNMGHSVFVGTKLSTITCDSSMFYIEDGILYSYDQRILYYYPHAKKDMYFSVPEQVKIIIRGCFSTSDYLWVIRLKHIQYNFDDWDFSHIYICIPKGGRKYINSRALKDNIFEDELVVENGVVYSSDKSTLYRYPGWLDIQEYYIDERCKIIEKGAFEDYYYYDDEWGPRVGFNKLTYLHLPNGLEEIKDYAFVGCGLLENLTIPPSVKKIGNFVFGQCINIITLTFLSRVEDIAEKAFYKGKVRIEAPLVNPHIPYVDVSNCDNFNFTNYPEIIICPNDTEQYYTDLFGITSTICTLNKSEVQIAFEYPLLINVKDYSKISDNELHAISSHYLRENIKDVVNIYITERDQKNIGISLFKLKEYLGENAFIINKNTERFYFSHNLSGICYITKNYSSKFVRDNCNFDSYNDAIDFACRIYYDVHGNILELDI